MLSGLLATLTPKKKANFHAVTFVCADGMCTPKYGGKEFIRQNGFSQVEDSMIHSIRLPGGVHNARFKGLKGFDVATQERSQIVDIEVMIDLKNTELIIIDGHNPCGACAKLSIDLEEQKVLLVNYAGMVYEEFGIPTVALLEDHSGEEHQFVVLKVFGFGPKSEAVAA